MKNKYRSLILVGVLAVTIPNFVWASPFAVTDNFDSAAVDACVYTLNDATTTLSVPPETIDSKHARCVIDLKDVPMGNNTIKIFTLNMWGVSDPAPFSFTRVLPPTPSNIRLEK